MRALVLPLVLSILATPALAWQAPGCKVSLKQFNEIKVGGPESALYWKTGCLGTVVSETKVAGYKTRMETWDGEGGGTLQVYIQNTKVINKTQFGLQ